MSVAGEEHRVGSATTYYLDKLGQVGAVAEPLNDHIGTSESELQTDRQKVRHYAT